MGNLPAHAPKTQQVHVHAASSAFFASPNPLFHGGRTAAARQDGTRVAVEQSLFATMSLD